MVEIGAGEIQPAQRMDKVTAASVVLTIDAALFLVIAVVGVPFLLYIFADDDTGTWDRMGPLISGWTVATVLGLACARVAVRAIGSGNYDFRRSGAIAGLTTAVAVGTLAGISAERSPVLAGVGTLFALTNIFAGLTLLRAEAPSLDDETAELSEFDYEPVDMMIEETPVHDTEDLAPRFASPAARRMRGRAAMVTHAGVRMSRRPRR